MRSDNKKASNGFIAIVIILIMVVFFVWTFWNDIEKIVINNQYKAVVPVDTMSVVNIELKKDILAELGKLKKYGEWPVSAVRISEDRGNPFKIKQ